MSFVMQTSICDYRRDYTDNVVPSVLSSTTSALGDISDMPFITVIRRFMAPLSVKRPGQSPNRNLPLHEHLRHHHQFVIFLFLCTSKWAGNIIRLPSNDHNIATYIILIPFSGTFHSC